MGLARNRSTPTNLEIRRGRVSPSGDTCPVSGIKQYGDWSHAKSAGRGNESNLAGFGLGGSFERDGVGMSPQLPTACNCGHRRKQKRPRVYTDREKTNRQPVNNLKTEAIWCIVLPPRVPKRKSWFIALWLVAQEFRHKPGNVEAANENKNSGDNSVDRFLLFLVRMYRMSTHSAVRNLGLHRDTEREHVSVELCLYLHSRRLRENLPVQPGCHDPDDMGL